jgi:hypothetical protein
LYRVDTLLHTAVSTIVMAGKPKAIPNITAISKAVAATDSTYAIDTANNAYTKVFF